MKENTLKLDMPQDSTQALAATTFQSYFNALLSHGAIEGGIGNQRLIEELEPAMEIIHKVLAGAELKVTIETVVEPDADLVQEFEAKRSVAETEANRVSQVLQARHIFL